MGLIPENELSKGSNVSLNPITNGAVVDQDRQTSIPGVYACGNVLHVHDLVDFVSEEAEMAGRYASRIYFAHLRQLKYEGAMDFYENGHLTFAGFSNFNDLTLNTKINFSINKELYEELKKL